MVLNSKSLNFPWYLSLAAACMMTGLTLRANAQVNGLDAPQAVGAYFNATFPASAPGQATGWKTENAFPNLTFVDPLWMTEIPGTNELVLVGKNGQIWRFENNPAVTQGQVTKVLEWVASTQSSEDQGFYSLAFHPEFGQAGSPNANYAYVCYNHKPALAGADANHSFWRVSRFTWLPASGTLDPASEFVLMNQYDRCRWHNGGAMFFGNDGFLYINCGDGGDSGEGGGLNGAGRRVEPDPAARLGAFQRCFPDRRGQRPAKSHPIRRQPQSPTNKPAGWPASFTQGYGIPNDNPWQDVDGSDPGRIPLDRFAQPAHHALRRGDRRYMDRRRGRRSSRGNDPRPRRQQRPVGLHGGNDRRSGCRAVRRSIGTSLAPDVDYNRSTGTCIIGGHAVSRREMGQPARRQVVVWRPRPRAHLDGHARRGRADSCRRGNRRRLSYRQQGGPRQFLHRFLW